SPLAGFGRWCFLTRLMPSTSKCDSSTIRNTVPRLLRSRPVTTTTSSPFLILRICVFVLLQHFRSQRHNLHEALGPQFTGYRSKNPGADGLQFLVKQHCCVTVELQQ